MPRIGKHYRASWILTIAASAALLTSGCRRAETVTFTEWSSKTVTSIDPTSPQAKIINIGESVERAAIAMAPLDKKGKPSNPLTSRTTFFPQQKKDARRIIGNSRAVLLSSIQKGMNWSHQPVGLDPAPAYLRGLRLIGYSILWEIEDSLRTEKYDGAVTGCINAHKVGAALLHGGGFEASLGCYLIDESRKKVLTKIGMFSALQLGNLAQGLQNSWGYRPDLARPIEHEKASMLLALQQAQDLFEAKKLDKLRERIGSSSRETIDLLQSIVDKPAKGKDVFDWVGKDIRARSEWLLKKAKDPRNAGPPPELRERRNWRLLYRYLATNLDSLVPHLLTTSTRTQLFIVECYLRQKVKVKRPLPKVLKAFSPSAVRDPYSGRPFFYKAEGQEFRIYSAGEDGIDNGGETDSAFKAPDMTVER
jgi:hypothetical protein